MPSAFIFRMVAFTTSNKSSCPFCISTPISPCVNGAFSNGAAQCLLCCPALRNCHPSNMPTGPQNRTASAWRPASTVFPVSYLSLFAFFVSSMVTKPTSALGTLSVPPVLRVHLEDVLVTHSMGLATPSHPDNHLSFLPCSLLPQPARPVIPVARHDTCRGASA